MSEVGLGGSIPQLNRSGQVPGSRALFHSVRDIALILDKTVKAGYGYLKAGTVMAVNTADGKLVPYPEAAADSNEGNGKAYLVADVSSGATSVQVTAEESYKFEVGDSLVLMSDGGTAEDLGAITAVSIGANGIATVTITNAASADHTVADSVHVYCKSDTSDPYAKAKYILDQDINTGTGSEALGANTSVVVSNAVLYTAVLVNLDAAAIADLGVVSDGRFTILK